ncbi:MAG: ABC transporter ATP-binding protein [Lachnospiraceae bacterium]|nr:ABC transporter ATP-binding protein [Lachnospiraceae bacterium]
MKEEFSIEVKDVRKKFKIYYDKGNSLKEKTLFRKRNKYEDHWVLKGIDISIKKGEAVGLIGRNGCGKSTTLKLINRIMYPTSGTIAVHGRVSSLIELGAGFHQDMSGRENIYTNAAIFGMTKDEIDEKIEEIIQFSELGEHIDNPVRTYSSGMYMRLGFSVAINVKADILLIDEILAVGDVSFQKKCFEKLQEIKSNGVTIVLVSHSMGQIEAICDRAIWLEEGEIKEEGKPSIVGTHYNSSMEAERLGKEEKREQKVLEGGFADKSSRIGNGKAIYTKIRLGDETGKGMKTLQMYDKFELYLEYEMLEQVREAVDFRICIIRNDGTQCYGSSTMGEKQERYLGKQGKISFVIDRLDLLPGRYRLDISMKLRDGTILDYIYFAQEFYVKEKKECIGEFGIFSMPHQWE